MSEIGGFLEYTFLGATIYSLILAVVVFVLFAFFRVLFSKMVLKTLMVFVKRTKTQIDDMLVEMITKPLQLLFLIIGFYFANGFLSGSDMAVFVNTIFRTFVILWIFYTIFVMLSPFTKVIQSFSNIFGKDLSRDVENFIIKSLKLFVIALGFMAMMREWGFDVSAFVASLGLGGLAFALAAKDTTANLFGSIVIFSDRPFMIGDWIKTSDVEGTVEDIGIRSTKVRAFDQSLVSIPNAVMANSAITNFSKMGKRRVKMKLGVTYQTTTKQLNELLTLMRDYLKNNPEVHPDTIMIYFDEFTDSSLGIFCYFFTNTTVWSEYLQVKERINLDIMKLFEDVGVEFAYPTQTLFLQKGQ